VRVDNLVVLACVLRAMTKNTKRTSTFSGKKSAPPNKILTTPMLSVSFPFLFPFLPCKAPQVSLEICESAVNNASMQIHFWCIQSAWNASRLQKCSISIELNMSTEANVRGSSHK